MAERTAELARRRIKVGCHWCVIPGIEYTLNDIVKINFAAVFDAAGASARLVATRARTWLAERRKARQRRGVLVALVGPHPAHHQQVGVGRVERLEAVLARLRGARP